MEKRVLATVAISMAILIGWYFIQAKFFPPPAVPTVRAPPSGGQPPVATAPVIAGAPPAIGGARSPEQQTTVQRDGVFRAVFSSWGAAPIEFTLLDPQYKTNVGGKAVPINMVRKEAGAPPFAVSFSSTGAESERSDFDLPADAAWTLVSQSPTELVYAADVGSVHVEKRWELPAAGYHLGLTVSVENRGAKPLAEHLVVAVAGWQDPSVQTGGFLSFGRRVNLTDGECDFAGKVKRVGFSPGGGCNRDPPKWGDPLTETGEVKWVGVGEQFFLSAAAFGPEPEGRTCTVSGDPSGRVVARAIYASRQIGPGQRTVYPMAAYLGPKLLHVLEAVTVGGAKTDLDNAVDYNLAYVARPMFWVLKKIQQVTRNWGLAIIVITLLLKLVMFYPTQKSMQSARSMAKLKPELDRLKEKFGDDKQGFSQAQMQLFKDKGVNPLGGCLPMVLQMPIYIAFYSMLSNAVELYRTSFVGPIDDMTAPYWPMAVATGALMFVQQKISPTSPDSQQQKTMMYMMPVMFMMFTLFLPSGLTLYILTNTLLTMAQQWYINRSNPDSPTPARKPARA